MGGIYQRLGERIRSQRHRLGWTQEELADRAGMHPAYIGQIERSQKKISLQAVERLASALGIGLGPLLDPLSPPHPAPDWESRIGGLLRDKKDSEKKILYSTLRHLARSIGKKK